MIRKNLIILYLVILPLLIVVGCSTLPEDFEKPESYAYTDTDDTRMGRARRDELNAHPGQSGFLLLGNGLDAFLARAILAENAERSIDAQYYLYHDDLIGRLFTDILLKAANRGVRVRVLVDDMDFEDRNQFIVQHRDSAYVQSLEKSDLAKTIRRNQVRYHWGKADVIYDQPEKIQHDFDETQYHLAPKLRPYFEGVTQELIIFSPYFVPGKFGIAFLRRLCERGVRVRIITNSLASNDVAIVHSGYSKYRKEMLRAGVELYEMNKKLTREQRRKRKRMGWGAPPGPVCMPNLLSLTVCYRGHVYCSSSCRREAQLKARRKAQSRYRTSDKGREAHCHNEKMRRLGKTKKTMADESTNTPPLRVILYPIVQNTKPRCRFCGVYGKICGFFSAPLVCVALCGPEINLIFVKSQESCANETTFFIPGAIRITQSHPH